MKRPTPALMIQATGSNAGKSTIVAGLARALVRRGLKVAPFKPQNMSNNAAVAIEGGEIGRAQAVQARAARMAPSVHMNPVLLKPETDTGAQIIVQGRRWGTLRAKNYLEKKAALLPAVLESFAYLARDADIILVEGAGSPAEINLRAGDIANMGFASAANVPVVMLGDIDRGGVIASLAGTHLVLEPDELARVHGFIVNKFRGDVGLFGEGLTAITRFTGWPSLGVVPWLPQAAWLPAEDAVDLDRTHDSSSTRVIAVPVLARIANFDDLDPLGRSPASSWYSSSRAKRSRPMPKSSSFPAASPRSAISPFCARRAGTSTSRRMSAVAGMCSGCAAAIKCWAGPSPIPTA